MSRPDAIPRDHLWVGKYARAKLGSPLTAHTLRTINGLGYKTWCGIQIERPTDDFAAGASDCLACRIRRDAA